MTFYHSLIISVLSFGMLTLSPSLHAITTPAPALPPPKTSSALPPSIHDKLMKSQVRPEDISIWIKAVGDEAPLLNHLAQTPRTPASTQKLITTAIALDMMGSDHRWQTRLYADGVVIGGVLYGDLIIKGSGDPSMTHDRLMAMLSQLMAKGIKHIKGDIVIDNLAFVNVAGDVNAFDGQGLRAYNAQPNAFLVNFGTLEVNMMPSGVWEFASPTNDTKPIIPETTAKFRATDDKVAVQILPPLDGFHAPRVIHGVNNACNDQKILPKFSLSDDALTITGQVGMGCGESRFWLTFADGDEFIKKAVRGTWQTLDTHFTGQVRLREPDDKSTQMRLPLLSFPSLPLSEQIYQINQYSNNVMTEQVALSLPLFLGRRASDYPGSFALIDAWWQQHMTTPKPIITKASGLCRDCFVTPLALGELLEFAHVMPNHAVFRQSLPIVGQTGTMKGFAKRHPNSPAIGRAFIKTGRLNNVASIAGYVLGKSGKTYAVVAVMNADQVGNNTQAHAVLDEVINWTAEQP